MILPLLLLVTGVPEVTSGGMAVSAGVLYQRALDARSGGSFEEAVPLLQEASRLDPQNLRYRAALAETLNWTKRFAEAERVYRDTIERFGRSRELRLGLARAILWQGRYAEAGRHFDALLGEDPGDASALEGRAQAAYWSGDFRRARSLFSRLLAVQPANAGAAKALVEIAAASRSLFRLFVQALDDSQPHQWARPGISLSWFSDPLTRWDLDAAAYVMEGVVQQPGSVGLSASSRLPQWRLGASAAARLVRFPDGEEKLLGEFSLSRSAGAHSTLTAFWQQTELLVTTTARDDHAWMSSAGVRWDVSSAWSASSSVRRVEYFDGNDGVSADAWMLHPLLRRGELTLSAGPAVSYRDVSQSRFRLLYVESQRTPTGYRYRYRGAYDPYWTPHDLREGRLAIVADIPARRGARIKLQLDGGLARDRAVGFGPLQGTTPKPLVTSAGMFERESQPWRAGVEFHLPFQGMNLSMTYRHNVTVFYRSDEIEAALVGRF